MTEDTDRNEDAQAPRDTRTRVGQLVFVSHDSRDADLAEAFSKLLMNVSAACSRASGRPTARAYRGLTLGSSGTPSS